MVTSDEFVEYLGTTYNIVHPCRDVSTPKTRGTKKSTKDMGQHTKLRSNRSKADLQAKLHA